MIRFENVVKVLGGRRVLDGADFTIEKGETFVIVGASGMGKSVTLKHMVHLMTPDEGLVHVGDACVSLAVGRELEAIRERFGYLFQGGALLAWLTVHENVALPLRERTAMPDDEICRRVIEVLELVGMAQDADKMPDEISGGMRKRVSLARSIVRAPEIILYDEPTSGLDPVSSRTIDALIDRMGRELGVTSVVVTHDLHSALSIGSRIGLLQDGRMIEIATPEDFVKSPVPEVQAFLESQFITKRGAWERNMA